MSSRNYDYILQVANTTNFRNSNAVIGLSSKTTGLIMNVDPVTSTIKVRLANTYQEFIVGEYLVSNVSTYVESTASVTYTNTAGQITGSVNTFALPSSNLVNFYTDSISVSFNGVEVPKSMWVYTGGNVIVKPLTHTKTDQTDLANLKAKLSESVKSSFYNATSWTPGTSISDNDIKVIQQSTNIEDFSYIVPDVDLERIFVGTAYDINFQQLYNTNLPTSNTSNLTVSLSYGDQNSYPFNPGYKTTEVTTANTTIISLELSKFVAEKNAMQQQPIVRLYTLYFPGEWYPPRESGNPNTEELGVAYPWPSGFPLRFAEIRGDYNSDITYRTQLGGYTYSPYPINSTGISLDSTGKINEVSLVVSNFDNLITALIENPFLCGYNSSNNASGVVNGEIVFNIDPRTNPSNVHFDAAYSSSVGINVAWTYETTKETGGTWQQLKTDTRDLLGGVVEIRTTFANLLDYWPEYSTVVEVLNGNYAKMRTTLPYRVGDIVHNNANDMANASSVIMDIVHPYLVLSNATGVITPGTQLFIKNPDASPDEFVLDTFKINNLDGLDDSAAKFSLTTWLQYFKNISPRRSFQKNSCPWIYKGDECQYPASGTGQIPGSKKTANGYFTINNIPTADPTQDVCSRNTLGCDLRNNGIHFGGFPGTGVSVPR